MICKFLHEKSLYSKKSLLATVDKNLQLIRAEAIQILDIKINTAHHIC